MNRSLLVLWVLAVAASTPSPRALAVAPGAYTLPARIQAEDFDSGGEGVGYHDTTSANLGGQYRPAEGVDISNVFPDDGTQEVGWIAAGEWLQYTFRVNEGGDYVLRLRLAQYLEGGLYHVELDGLAATPQLAVPDTGTYRHWVTVPAARLTLTAGVHRLRLVFDQDGVVGGVMNLNWIELVPTVSSVPGRIQAEDFDGIEGVGYHDVTPWSSGLYRLGEWVDINNTFPDDDHTVAVEEINAGEWLRYSVQVTSAGSYELRMRLAQFGDGGVFHVMVDGAAATGPVTVPHTTAYANWITLPVGTLSLTAGQHSLHLVFDQNGTNGGVMNLNWLELLPVNPVVQENGRSGTTAWADQAELGGVNDITYVDSPLKGYASATSVNRGSSITFYVHHEVGTVTATLQIFRMGYYGGANGRLLRVTPISVSPQSPCAPAANGQIECDWQASYTLDIPRSWASGVYIAKVTAPNASIPSGIAGNYIPFVVRDDERMADLLYVQPVTTYQAYNGYPSSTCASPTGPLSKSLYEFNSVDGRATHVSFRRPHCGNGAGGGAGGGSYTNEVLVHELNLIAFLEHQGFDVTYTTSVDLHRATPGDLLRYRGILSVGHDEYWSSAMRDTIEEVRDHGVHLAFFGSNAAYWQVRFEDDEQTMVCYKEDDAGLPIDPYPYDVLKTARFRTIGRPEQWLLGIQYYGGCCVPVDRYWPIEGLLAEAWAFAASPIPVTPETAIDLTLGQEVDSFEELFGGGESDGLPVFAFAGGTTRASNPGRIPENRLQTLATSRFWRIGDGLCGPPDPGCEAFPHNTSLYQAPSGAWVFASGTIGWSLNLANVGRYFQANDIMITATANILRRFLADSRARPATSLARHATVISRSSYEGSWWSRTNVNDGRRSSAFGTSMGYSSETGWTSSHEEWVGLHLPAIATFSRIVLFARNDESNVGGGFPVDFRIQVWDGMSWIDRAVIVDYPRPDGTGQSFTFAPATTDRVRILASRLRPVGGEYYLQLAEIELPAADVDGDEVPDDLDNCPAVWSADQVDTDADGVGDACDAVASSFRRGDPNANGGTDISDAVAIFAFLFLGGSTPSCLDAADADDSGQINITDGIFLLGGLFLGTRLPPQPGPTTCGSDPTPDALPGCSYSPGLCTP